MIRINLVPKEERGKSKRKIDWNRMGIVMAGSVTLLFVALIGFNAVLGGMYRAKLDAMAPDMANLRRQQGELRSLQRENSALQKDIAAAQDFVSQDANQRIVSTLQGIAEATPADVWLSHIYMTSEESVSAAGFAARPVDLSALLEEIKAVEGVKSVELPTIGWKGEGSSRLQMFSLNITLEGGRNK